MLAIPLGIEITAALLGKALLYGTKEIKKRIAQAQQQNTKGGASSHFPENNFPKKNPRNMHHQVKKGQAPKSIKAVNEARIAHEKHHIHFKDNHALNHERTWKHRGRALTTEGKTDGHPHYHEIFHSPYSMEKF